MLFPIDIVFIKLIHFSPEEAAVKKVADDIQKIAKDNKAKITDFKELGLKKLAYSIKKEINGYYFVMNFEADADAVKELDRKTSLNEDVLRHLIIKEDEE